jgi:hypothetical protein
MEFIMNKKILISLCVLSMGVSSIIALPVESPTSPPSAEREPIRNGPALGFGGYTSSLNSSNNGQNNETTFSANRRSYVVVSVMHQNNSQRFVEGIPEEYERINR